MGCQMCEVLQNTLNIYRNKYNTYFQESEKLEIARRSLPAYSGVSDWNWEDDRENANRIASLVLQQMQDEDRSTEPTEFTGRIVLLLSNDDDSHEKPHEQGFKVRALSPSLATFRKFSSLWDWVKCFVSTG